MLEVFNSFLVFGVLLIVGVVIRGLLPPIQKVLLPASLIGGIIGLVLGPQLLGIIDIPTVFSEVPSIGMRIIMACVPMGITVTAKRIYQHLDFTFANMTVFGFQMIFGLILGAVLIKFWPSLPEGWGLMGNAAYFGSHGSVPVVSDVIDKTGEYGAQSIGMVMATIGILFAMIPGMAIANYGARKGLTKFTTDVTNQPLYFFRGTLPEEKQDSIGKIKVNPTNVTAIALQFGILAVSIKFGEIIFKTLANIVPFLGNVSPMLWGLVGGLILWPVMMKLKLDDYVDKGTINQISNFTLEVVILAAFTTIRLDIVSQLIVPLLIHGILILSASAVFIFAWMRYLGHDQWFEKSLMLFGMTSGSNAQGLSLVRAIDPENKSVIYEALGVYNAVFFWNFIVLPFAASIVLYNRTPIYIIGAGLMLTSILGTILFSRDRKANNN